MKTELCYQIITKKRLKLKFVRTKATFMPNQKEQGIVACYHETGDTEPEPINYSL